MNINIDTLFSVLVYQYFAPPNCFIIISDSNTLNLPVGVVSVNVDVTRNISQQIFGNFGCQNFILNVKNPKNVFEELEDSLWHNSQEKFNKRRYLIFDQSLNIFSSTVMKFVANVLLVQVNESDCPRLLVHNDCDIIASFWTNQYTKKSKIHLLDQWFSHNKSFLLKNNLYYNKIQQQDGKKILVGVFDYRPYIIIDKDIASGLEIHLLREIVKNMNATLELVIQEDLWGLVHPNKTGYGLRGNLYFDKLDIGAAGLFMTYSTSEHFDQSRGYANAELTCLVPAPRLAAAWLSPTYSFSPHLWFLLFLTYVTLIVIVYALNHYQMSIKKHNISRFISKTTILISSIESVCKPLLGHNFSRKKYYFKPLMGLVLLSTLIVCTAYVAGFASVLTKPIYETSINTMEDFLSSDISWGGVQTADYIMSWASSEQELYRKAAERYVATTPAHLEYIFRHNRNFAFKVERVNGQYHIDSYIHEQSMKYYMTMKDPIQTQYVVLTFTKNSILLPVANRIIERLVDSGIILYWTNEYSGHQDYVMKKKLQYAHVRRNNENVAITLSHVVSAFFIIGFGNIIASVVFLFELLLKRQISRT